MVKGSPAASEVGQLHEKGSAVPGVTAVRERRADAFITDASTLQYWANLKPCDLEVVGENFGPGTLVYGLQKNSTLTKPLNRGMLKVMHPPIDMHVFHWVGWGDFGKVCGRPVEQYTLCLLPAVCFSSKGLQAAGQLKNCSACACKVQHLSTWQLLIFIINESSQNIGAAFCVAGTLNIQTRREILAQQDVEVCGVNVASGT